METSRRTRSDSTTNRALLIDVARRVLADQPRASMASIAATAGLGRNTIHRHFATRQDLLDAIRLQAADEAAANEVDALRPAGELGSPVPARMVVSEVLNKVPPFRLGEQIVAEAERLPGVMTAAIYVVDLDGTQLRRLAGADAFPAALPVDVAVGPEIPREATGALRASIASRLPGVLVAPMFLRGRATGVLMALGSEDDDGLRELAGVAAAALSLADRYTDQGERASRARKTSPSAEIQQNMLPPRIVRVGGAMIAGHVTPGYDIGGDWFDYAENAEGTWIGIADTDGSGPRTAAVASVVLGAFRSERHVEDATPTSVVRAMDRTARELEAFAVPVSTTVALWHGATSTVEWATCGPVRPLLVTADGAVRAIGEHAGPLGASDGPSRPRIQRLGLAAGERLLLVSDGLLDHQDESGVAFGIAGIERALALDATASAASTIRTITDAANAHAEQTFRDDATLVALATTARAPAGRAA